MSFEAKVKCINDPDYPSLLKQIPNPPLKIFYKGNWNYDLFEKCLSVVGSRNITSYGICIIEHFFGGLSGSGLSIVSGFMRGVDLYAHENALLNGMSTIAVLPCGIDYKHSFQSQYLQEKIIESGGLIISEFDGAFEPRNWTFVKRNRIVAGLSSALFVIEAGLNSGSLITYDYAKKYNRMLFTVPGDIFRSSESGINMILKDGALPVFSANDIRMKMGIDKAVDQKPVDLTDIDPISQKIITCLNQSACDLSQICKLTSENFTDVCISVTNLQLKNYIKEIKGVFYVV